MKYSDCNMKISLNFPIIIMNISLNFTVITVKFNYFSKIA